MTKKEKMAYEKKPVAVKTADEDMKKLLKSREKARFAEAMKTVKWILKGDKENLAKLGKHELLCFSDSRLAGKGGDKEDEGVVLVYGDTLKLTFAEAVLIVSYANVKAKESVYSVTEHVGSIFRIDGKRVTLDDVKFMVKAFGKHERAKGSGAKGKSDKKKKKPVKDKS